MFDVYTMKTNSKYEFEKYLELFVYSRFSKYSANTIFIKDSKNFFITIH